MDNDKSLDVLEFEDTSHDLVDFDDAVLFLGLVFLFQESQTKRYKNVHPAPESEVAAECKQAGVQCCGAKVLVCKVLGGKGQEDGVGEELASCQADRLRGTGI